MAQFANALPGLQPGQAILRLSPSKTGRAIYPNMLGKLGGLDPSAHDNPIFTPYSYLNIQWTNGLWSSLDASDRGITWQFYPTPNEEVEEQLEESGL